jgi:hypothetical protein
MGGHDRPRPCASVQETEGSIPAPQPVANGRAPLDRPRTAPGTGVPSTQPRATLSALLRLLVAVVVYLVLVMVKVVILTSIAVTATTATENPTCRTNAGPRAP